MYLACSVSSELTSAVMLCIIKTYFCKRDSTPGIDSCYYLLSSDYDGKRHFTAVQIGFGKWGEDYKN